MRVSSLSISNFRSFVNTDQIELGQMNVLIGANNSGKSSVLKALAQMQQGLGDPAPDNRLGTGGSHVEIMLAELGAIQPWSTDGNWISGHLRIMSGSRLILRHPNGNEASVSPLPAQAPQHFVVPYFSKRKTGYFSEDVKRNTANAVGPTMANLAAKLSLIANPYHPNHQQYSTTCEAILDFVVTAAPSDNGSRAGMYISEDMFLPIDQMGEGVPNIVALLADLALSKGKLFLIEEPENDLHPQALKALLDLIAASSSLNQFVVSTHSNIVVRHLCSMPGSKLYKIESKPKTYPPEASIKLVPESPEARIEVLRELGYAFSDFNLWDGWLILEESTAERVIRDFLIPWFAPRLTRVRTVSAGGNNKVAATFEDFNRLFRFTHLEPAYKNAAWVRIDGDDEGKAIIGKLTTDYKDWGAEHFGCFELPQFELYYPKEFSDEVAQALAIQDRQQKRAAKKALFEKVYAWLDADHERGSAALSESAAEIIQNLQQIEAALYAPKKSPA